jgi:hypothetical protein
MARSLQIVLIASVVMGFIFVDEAQAAGTIRVRGQIDGSGGPPTGAQFRITNIFGYNSGWINLPSDGSYHAVTGLTHNRTYSIQFSDESGYVKPGNQSEYLTNGETGFP